MAVDRTRRSKSSAVVGFVDYAFSVLSLFIIRHLTDCGQVKFGVKFTLAFTQEMQDITQIDKLYEQLFARIEQLGKNGNRLDACEFGVQHGPVELALFHLSTSRNLLKKYPAQVRRKMKGA